MTDDDDLRVNTLHRFGKQSPNLVLHEYSHCEVPAGCGGVVLRWIDPASGHPATFRIHSVATRADLWLDGTRVTSSLGLLQPGQRTLALHLRRTEVAAQPFTISVTYDDDDDETELVRGGRWRCSTAPPPDGWVAPELDDRSWSAVPIATPELLAAQEDWTRRRFEDLAGAGLPVLVLDADELWVRVTFTAPEPP